MYDTDPKDPEQTKKSLTFCPQFRVFSVFRGSIIGSSTDSWAWRVGYDLTLSTGQFASGGAAVTALALVTAYFLCLPLSR